MESRHHNHSKDMLLGQNKGRRDDKVSSQSWKECTKYYFSGQTPLELKKKLQYIYIYIYIYIY